MSILAVLPVNDFNVPLASLKYFWFGILSMLTAGLGFIWKCDLCKYLAVCASEVT